jgi:hypothetical protein
MGRRSSREAFLSPEAALAAVAECAGPLFRVPAPETIEAVELEAAKRADRQCAAPEHPSR